MALSYATTANISFLNLVKTFPHQADALPETMTVQMRHLEIVL